MHVCVCVCFEFASHLMQMRNCKCARSRGENQFKPSMSTLLCLLLHAGCSCLVGLVEMEIGWMSWFVRNRVCLKLLIELSSFVCVSSSFRFPFSFPLCCFPCVCVSVYRYCCGPMCSVLVWIASVISSVDCVGVDTHMNE